MLIRVHRAFDGLERDRVYLVHQSDNFYKNKDAYDLICYLPYIHNAVNSPTEICEGMGKISKLLEKTKKRIDDYKTIYKILETHASRFGFLKR